MAKIKAKTSKTKKNTFEPSSIELKWQAKWEKERVYQPDLDAASFETASQKNSHEAKKNNDKSGTPFYNLMMFPYPSAEGLHVGSIYTFGGIDVYGRFKRMRGHQVFEPIGL